MILSHKYKFIFLKTNKTAGTSIEIALSRFCGPDDIITPISPEDEETRRELGYRGPQNFRPDPAAETCNGGHISGEFYNHMSAGEIRALVGEETWDQYFKFCVERNPWDRMVSMYYWIHRSGEPPPFAEFLCSQHPERLRKFGFELYTIDGVVAVDRICRYESLVPELDAVMDRLQIPGKLQLVNAKSRFRQKSRHFRQYYSAADRDKVAELFSREIALMGYTFQS